MTTKGKAFLAQYPRYVSLEGSPVDMRGVKWVNGRGYLYHGTRKWGTWHYTFDLGETRATTRTEAWEKREGSAPG